MDELNEAPGATKGSRRRREAELERAGLGERRSWARFVGGGKFGFADIDDWSGLPEKGPLFGCCPNSDEPENDGWLAAGFEA